jgi:N-acetylglucosaminyldiphosphoundecaprenol N-acetyl-beta-D-mannosaminyltransferase
MATTTVSTCSSFHPEFAVLGVPLKALNISDLIAQMERWIERGEQGRCITFANVHVVMEARRDPAFYRVLSDEATFNVPDGMPLIWSARFQGLPLNRRVYGPDVMDEFCGVAARKGYRHFFYGGAPGVPERLAANLQRRHEGTWVAGAYSPPFRPLTAEEDEEVVAMINDARPDVLWLGLGCPKQEIWAFEHCRRLNVPIIACVGQAFDIYSGHSRQAPAWMRDNGLEWMYRLMTNPRRLWKRYLVYNSQFILLLTREFMRL